ncbi:MAG: ABC transporter permease [Nitrospinota bacterium]
MNIETFFKFVSMSIQKQLTYRFDYFVGILNAFLYVFIFTSVWSSLYANAGGAVYQGFSITGIITYAVFAMVIRVSFSMDDTAVPSKVRDGSVAIDLIRPISFFYMQLAQSLGHSIFHIFARSLPVLFVSMLFFDVTIPLTANLFLFPLMAILGYLILFMVNYVIGLLAFWFIEIFPFLLFKYGLITLFSGGIVPVDFFPDFVKPALSLLPFQYILYTPTVALTGHVTGTPLYNLLMGQIIWVFLLALLSKVMWNLGRGKLMIQGG